ncbi:unnamed protein product [Rotaria sp. Silwood1]|nr:unnamed protein product [Rotaria sp. Silwood1]CAF1633966.1 unnamed protein product [Rotaria sp. Silwood1]
MCASNNDKGRNESKASHGNVDDCLVRSYNSSTSSIRTLSDDDIIDELSIIVCSLLTCLLFNGFCIFIWSLLIDIIFCVKLSSLINDNKISYEFKSTS